MRLDHDVPIEMDDGVVLRADVFRPEDDGQYPVLMCLASYGKDLPFSQGWPYQWAHLVEHVPEVTHGSSCRHQVWETPDPERWVPHGYVCVRVDARGAGRSPGYLDPFSPRERLDYYECIEWAARQPWSTGKVGLNGISYYAVNQWLVAALQPPHLAAICVWEGAADWYRDWTYHGGIQCQFWPYIFDMQIRRVQHGLGERGLRSDETGILVSGDETLTDEELAANRCDPWADVRAHPLDDTYHRDRSPEWSAVRVPLLSAANWGGHGLHARGNFEGFTRAASDEKWLEVHGLEHWTHFYSDYGVSLQRRFFDHYLKGEGSWLECQPRVLLQVRHPEERFVQRAEREWPLYRTAWTRFHLHADRRTLCEIPPRREVEVQYASDGDGLTFWGPQWGSDVEITGPLSLRLWVSSDASDIDVFAIVRVFDPSGQEVLFRGTVDPKTPVAQGWLRASHAKLDDAQSVQARPYHQHKRRDPLAAGERRALSIEIWPTSIVVPAGYRMALTIRGRDYDHGLPGVPVPEIGREMRGCSIWFHDDPADRPADVVAANVRVHTGLEADSHLLVPIIPAGAA